MASMAEVQRRALAVLEEAARSILLRVRAALEQLAEDDGRLEVRSNAREVRSLIDQLRRIARREGADVVLELLAAELPDQVEADLRRAGVEALDDFAPRIADTLDRLFRGEEERIAAVFDRAASEVASALRRAVVTGQDLDGAISAVAKKLDTTFGRAATAVDTAVAGFSRAAVTTAITEIDEEIEGDTLGAVYLGPEDGKNRPFCAAHVERWYTVAEIQAMQPDPGQPPPVAVFAGGYNCRHEWVPTLRSDAGREQIPIGGVN